MSSDHSSKIVVKFLFTDDAGNPQEKSCEATVGLSILDVARKYDVELEGACEGSCACATCHVILEQKYYDVLPAPKEAELDMLDLAFGLTKFSRLGCQCVFNGSELDGAVFTIPKESRNIR